MFESYNRSAQAVFIVIGVVTFCTALPLAAFAQNSPLTVQPSTGRVGVGTTTPNSKIEAKGTDVGISVMNNSGTQNYYIGIKDSDGNKFYLGRGKDPSQGLPPAITVDTTDNVGIGKTSPGYKLDVNGTVNAASFRGDGSQLTNLPSSGGSAVLHKVTANTTVTNTTNETDLYSFTVPGGTLGTNNMLRLTVQITDLGMNNTGQCVLRFKYGGTTLAALTLTNGSGASFAGDRALITFIIAADGVTNAQVGTASFQGSTVLLNRIIGQGTSAADSTAAQTLVITADWNGTSSNRTITLGQAILEKLS